MCSKVLFLLKKTINRLQQHGVGAILDYAVEEELSEEKAKDLEMSSCQPEADLAFDKGTLTRHCFLRWNFC